MKFLWVVLVGMLMACGESSTDCSRQSDCFRGEICSDGRCVSDGMTPVNNTNSTSTNVVNILHPNNNQIDLPNLACVVNPFEAVCTDPDDNDTFSEAFNSMTRGCLTGDNMTALDETRSFQLCSREIRDRYSQMWVGCDTKSFVMEIIFTPQQECDRRVFKFSVAIDGKNCEQSHPEIQCVDLDNGGVHITALVNPNRSVNSSSFTVEALFENAIQFDYNLQWIIRE